MNDTDAHVLTRDGAGATFTVAPMHGGHVETFAEYGKPVPARLTKLRSMMHRWRTTHGWVDPVYTLDPTIRVLPSATWRLLAAIDDIHNAAHDARRDWWLGRADRPRRQAFVAIGTLFASVIFAAWSQLWVPAAVVAAVAAGCVVRLLVLRVAADIDGIEVHRVGRYKLAADQLDCIGGPGQLPGWVGQMLTFPATVDAATPSRPLGEFLGTDRWIAGLDLAPSERETLEVLLVDWDGATLAEAVDVARALNRS